MVHITGIRTVLLNIRRRHAKMGIDFERGATLAGLTLQRASQLKVPVDFGVLKNSAFTRKEGIGLSASVIVGYTASYAVYVHENVEMKGKGLPRKKPSKGRYWDPQGRGQAKFLEEPARSMARELRNIILATMRI